LSEALSLFSCVYDSDIEEFLHEKAVQFSDRNWCRVYFLVNEEYFNKGRLKIEGYFTLSHKSLNPADVKFSKNHQKKISGGISHPESLEFVLIGQLGKFIKGSNDGSLKASKLSAKEILDAAFEIIQQADELIPCSVVLVECSSCEKIRKIYMDYGFQFLQIDGEHYQYYKMSESAAR
jgi:hypothetical protein